MIAYLTESIPVSSDIKKLMDAMDKVHDNLYKSFQRGLSGKMKYSLILPDGKPCVWFQKKVSDGNGGKSDILVYCYTLDDNHGKRLLRICIRFHGFSRIVPIGQAVVDMAGKGSDEFKISLKASRIVRDMVKRVSTEDDPRRILHTVNVFADKMSEKDW